MSANSNFKFYVIGVGLSRTGTLSPKTALEVLLPGRCMHLMPSFLSYEKMKDAEKYLNNDLKDVFEKDVSDEEFKKYFVDNNIVAGVDVPFISKYQQAMRVFPDALVLLTVREPESWVISVKNTLCDGVGFLDPFPYYLFAWLRPPVTRLINMLDNNLMYQDLLRNVKNGEGVEYYNKHVEKIKATVPAERLVIFNVKDGWKPLCDALNLPIPDVEFPRVNDTAAFRFNFTFVKIVTWGMFITGVTVPILVGYGLNRYFDIVNLNSI